MQHEIVAADVDRFGLEFFRRLFAPLASVPNEIGRDDELPAAPGRLHGIAA